MRRIITSVAAAAALGNLLAGCASVKPGSAIASAETRGNFPSESVTNGIADYRIAPLDKINVTTFQVKDLTLTDIQVDSSGHVLLPLIGSVQASGRTTTELSHDIADRLSQRYLRSPQVTVSISESVGLKVTVEGSVTEPGVYELKGETSLLQALAMAKGPSRVAALRRVAIFREVKGQRMAAIFDINQIRTGSMDDPEILGNDVVVVGLSNVKAAWRDVLTALPALGVFAQISTL